MDLAAHRGRCNVVVWFSRGFTVPGGAELAELARRRCPAAIPVPA